MGQAASFGAPAVPPGCVARPRLDAALDLAARRRLTIVVAPPGYGKTVLLSQWAATHRGRLRWLSLRPEHDDLRAFCAAVRGALAGRTGRGAGPGRANGGARFPGLGPGGSPPVVAALLAELEGVPPTTLVLDDFHVLGDPALLAGLAALVEHAPRTLHVVLATRVDPALPYHLRLAEAIVELRQEDLAFTNGEARELVTRLCGRPLAARQVDTLTARTEGWAVALQLAAISLRERDDVDAYLARFANEDRHVADYLTEQVLAHQPEPVRRFLLSTSVLERMSGPLCDAVTGHRGGQVQLEELEGRSLFITCLDAQREWFRYHELFRTLLRQHLRHRGDEPERALLRRAAAWHLAHDDLAAGVGYLAEAGDWDAVVDVAAAHGREGVAQARAVAPWIGLVPGPELDRRPRARLVAAASATLAGDLAAAGDALDAVESGPPGPCGQRAMAALLRAYWELRQGNPGHAASAAGRASLELGDLGAGDELPDVLGLVGGRAELVAAAGAVRGAALVHQGEFEEARRALAIELDGAHEIWQVLALGASALLEAWSGRLGEAERIGSWALSTARQVDLDDAPFTIDAQLALLHVARERGELAEASARLQELSDAAATTGQGRLVPTLLVIEDELLALAGGRADLDPLALGRSRRAIEHAGLPRAVAARRAAAEALLHLAADDLDGAARALERAPLRTIDVAAAAVRLAVERGDAADAREQLGRWPAQPVPRAPLERRLWLAIVDQLDGDEAAARQQLAGVVTDAELEGHVALFRGGHAQAAARALHRAWPTPFLDAILDLPPPPARSGPVKELAEQLTEREYAVLQLLPTRLPNTEIADALDVSLNTVKTHLKHLYRKLGVTSRSEAVAQAERLRLL